MSAIDPSLSLYLENFAEGDRGDWKHLVDWVVTADHAGVDRVALSDHLAFGEHLEDYADPTKGGIEGGRQPTGPDGHWLEPITTISYLCARTSRITFVTRILLAALRSPVLLAKMTSTLDVLSGGRLELGVGVGWQRQEYEAVGIPFERRGSVLDEVLEVCCRLWTQPVVNYRRGSLNLANIHQMPKPSRQGDIPIWVSGTVNERSMDRLARYGSGWIPWGADAFDIVRGIEKMRTAISVRGREPDEIGVTAVLPLARRYGRMLNVDETVGGVESLRRAGVTDFCIRFDPDERSDRFADQLLELVSAFREVVPARSDRRPG